MLGAVAGVSSREGVEIEGAESVAISFPGFYELLDRLSAEDDRRDRWPRRGRQEHRRPPPRRAARLPLPRHRGDVPRAHVARAARRAAAREGDPLGELARKNPVVFDEVGRVFIAGSDVTSNIRQSRIDRMVPVVARHHEVREVMRERQRELGRAGERRDRGARHRHGRRARRRGEGLPPGRSRHPRAPAPGRAARTSAPTRSRPTCARATRATACGCSRPRTPS